MSLSRTRHGFDFRMGHMLPHPYNGWSSLILPLELAVHRVLAILYRGIELPTKPKTTKFVRLTDRNAEIKAKYLSGVSVPVLPCVP